MNKKINNLKEKVIPVLKKAGVTRSAVFGSFVKGKMTKNSDIDLLVNIPQTASLLDFSDLKLKLEERLKRKVDLVEYSTIKPRLKKSILESQIQIL